MAGCASLPREWEALGVWGLDNSDTLKLHEPQAGQAGDGDLAGTAVGGPWNSSLTGQVVLSRSVEHQTRHPWDHSRYRLPHTPAWDRGRAGHWGWHGARGQANGATKWEGYANKQDLHEQVSWSSMPPLFLEGKLGGVLYKPWLES